MERCARPDHLPLLRDVEFSCVDVSEHNNQWAGRVKLAKFQAEYRGEQIWRHAIAVGINDAFAIDRLHETFLQEFADEWVADASHRARLTMRGE
jgi:hypothetical protein